MSRAYDSIAAALLAMTDDAGNWRPCWHRAGLTMPTNRLTNRQYRGANVLSLWVSSEMRGYASSEWATFKQWLELDQVVMKGERGTPVVYWGEHRREVDGEEKGYKFAKGSTVFNISQVHPLEGKEPLTPAGQKISAANPDERVLNADTFAANTEAKIMHLVGVTPCYIPALDCIHMPAFESFHHAQGYYGTLLHELTHWTRAKHRLNRNWQHKDGEQSRYALEELVAELGAAFLCADLGIENEPRPDHAQYLAHWHEVLKRDVPAFMHAVGLASAAAQYLHSLQLEEAA